MSQEKNATDDPPRSPPDQGGAVNRSFSIHEIQDMSDDESAPTLLVCFTHTTLSFRPTSWAIRVWLRGVPLPA